MLPRAGNRPQQLLRLAPAPRPGASRTREAQSLAGQDHKASRASAGSRTLAKELQANGHRVGRYMARSLMREAGIASRQRRRH
ncbi:IS3 family transposase [Pseudomonas chlororaphis]|uniref:IS3 family transposase n=1 Tax=Pseudomonas chlororaphis TaxID=587753 RepID=UPI00240847B1|nr:IS3 family transposase [Pseudomonas chlororaphis]